MNTTTKKAAASHHSAWTVLAKQRMSRASISPTRMILTISAVVLGEREGVTSSRSSTAVFDDVMSGGSPGSAEVGVRLVDGVRGLLHRRGRRLTGRHLVLRQAGVAEHVAHLLDVRHRLARGAVVAERLDHRVG